MRTIIALFFLTFSLSSHASIAACGVFKTWLEGKGAQEICKLHDGSFCSSVKNKGQGICLAAKGDFCSTVENIGQGICLAAKASFCSTVKNIAQGICLALDKSFCSQMESGREEEMIKELKKACNIDRTVNIHD